MGTHLWPGKPLFPLLQPFPQFAFFKLNKEHLVSTVVDNFGLAMIERLKVGCKGCKLTNPYNGALLWCFYSLILSVSIATLSVDVVLFLKD